MFTYWGRRGPITQFALLLASEAVGHPDLSPIISVSRQNECFDKFVPYGQHLFPVDTFRHPALGALLPWRVLSLRRDLYAKVREEKIEAVIELMPHIWSPLVMQAARSAGAKYFAIVHDADPHVGDRTSLVNDWLKESWKRADGVITLSGAVAGRLEESERIPMAKLFTLFHPDLCYSKNPFPPVRLEKPYRLLFLGRIVRYKGLPLFLDMAELLRKQGIDVRIGVFGEGVIGAWEERLGQLDAEVVNHWLTPDEIVGVLSRYHAVVVSHTEASQSGVIAAAFGAGTPVIATPVGGLVEQVKDGVTGILASRADGAALADAAKRLLLDSDLYDAIRANIERTKDNRSMRRFVDELIAHTLKPDGRGSASSVPVGDPEA